MPVRGSTRLVRQAGPRGRNGGTRVQGTVLNLAAGFSCPFWSHTGAQGLRGEKGSEVPPYPLSPSQGNSSGPAQGRRWRGWYPGQVHLGSMWKAGSGNSCGQQGCKGSSEPALALISQSSEGHTGHTLPAVVLSVSSPPLDQSRVSMVQKMLCLRFFPRPGC